MALISNHVGLLSLSIFASLFFFSLDAKANNGSLLVLIKNVGKNTKVVLKGKSGQIQRECNSNFRFCHFRFREKEGLYTLFIMSPERVLESHGAYLEGGKLKVIPITLRECKLGWKCSKTSAGMRVGCISKGNYLKEKREYCKQGQICRKGICSANCKEGTAICSGRNIKQCVGDGGGLKWITKKCPGQQVCRGGTCGADCRLQARKCKAGFIQKCVLRNGRRVWANDKKCASRACIGNQCKPPCRNGEQRCDGRRSVKICQGGIRWKTHRCLSGQVCKGGFCKWWLGNKPIPTNILTKHWKMNGTFFVNLAEGPGDDPVEVKRRCQLIYTRKKVKLSSNSETLHAIYQIRASTGQCKKFLSGQEYPQVNYSTKLFYWFRRRSGKLMVWINGSPQDNKQPDFTDIGRLPQVGTISNKESPDGVQRRLFVKKISGSKVLCLEERYNLFTTSQCFSFSVGLVSKGQEGSSALTFTLTRKK